MTISKENSSKVLTIGLEYIDHRGGIGGVIENYSKYFPGFKFIATYKPQKYKIQIFPFFLKAALRLIGVLSKDKEIQIVHIHGAAKGSLLRKYLVFAIAKYGFSKKVIFHCHASELKVFYESSNGLIKKWIASFFNNVDLIICLSKQWETFFLNEFEPKRVIILENIVEKQNFQRPENNKGHLELLFLGNIGQRKGIFDLLEMLSNKKEILQGKLHLSVGGDGQVEKLKNFIEENELSQIVTYVGWVSGSRKTELLKLSDAYILPSYNEGLPLSILEAMSFGLPILSTPVGGIEEVVWTGENGYLFEPGDRKAMAGVLEKIVNEPEKLNKMGSKSLNIVEPYYAEAVMEKLNNIYDEMCGENDKVIAELL